MHKSTSPGEYILRYLNAQTFITATRRPNQMSISHDVRTFGHVAAAAAAAAPVLFNITMMMIDAVLLRSGNVRLHCIIEWLIRYACMRLRV